MPMQLRGKYQYYTKADISKLREAGYTKKFYDIKAGVEDLQFTENEKRKLEDIDREKNRGKHKDKGIAAKGCGDDRDDMGSGKSDQGIFCKGR